MGWVKTEKTNKLSKLGDIDFSKSPADRNILVYDETNNVWVPGSSRIELTQAEYDALEQAGELEKNVPYFITDVNGDGSQFQPIIYSTTEREIGVWLDGKPVYEKTQYISALPSSTGDWVNYPHGISNFDRLISVSATAYDSDIPQQLNIPHVSAVKKVGIDPQIAISVSVTDIAFIVGDDRSSWEAYVTIRYTKTTDTAGSGTWTPQGVPAVHYSTDERVVGTWIDGSTLYERTFVSNALVSGNNEVGDFSDVTPSLIWVEKGFVVSQGASVPNMYYTDNDADHIKIYARQTDNTVRCICSNYYVGGICYAIIRYTKSST